MTKSLQLEKASNVGIIKYLNIVIAVIAGYLIFAEPPTYMALGGIALIIASVYLGSKSANKTKQKKNN